jgi:molecular chaperone GrpE
MGPTDKDRLIEEFRSYLDQTFPDDELAEDEDSWGDAEGEANADTNVNTNVNTEVAKPEVDLFTLLSEMAMLKNEIRLESRQFKAMLEEMRKFGDVLSEQNERLNRDLERSREQVTLGKRQAERGLLLGLLDLRDRLQAGVDASLGRTSSFWARLAAAEVRFADSMAQGQALTLQRIDQLLSEYQVRPLEAIGLQLDPHLMRAVGVENLVDKPDGQVLREARRGFYHHGELLRAAEVIVNKRML